MRKEIYTKISERLRAMLPEIASIDLWNHQTDDPRGREIYKLPAIFVEFETIEWTQNLERQRSGTVGIRLHLVTHNHWGRHQAGWQSSESLAFLDLIDRMNRAMSGLRGEHFGSMQVTTSATNHHHGEILESVERYETHCIDRTSMKQRVLVNADLELSMGRRFTDEFREQFY